MFKILLKSVALVLLVPLSSFAGIINITDPNAVTASSHYLNFEPENVIDGVLPTSYLDPNTWNAGSESGWLQVDLGNIYTIDLVELYITTGNHFNILVGDGAVWSQLNSTLQQTAPYATPGTSAHAYSWYNVTPGNTVSGQYLRYEVVAGGGHWAHLAEIKISGTLPSSGSNPIPEPSIIALFGLGLIGLGFARRHRLT